MTTILGLFLILFFALVFFLMAAPAPTARGTPSGVMLDDGHPTKVTFSSAPTISLKEKTTKPPGYDGGDPIDTTTFFNTTFRTKAARALIDVTDGQFTCAYDPNVYTAIAQQINREQTITVTFSDGSTLAFFGYMKSFEPNDASEGEMPEATVTFVSTNFDPAGKVEAAPVMTQVAGT